MSDNKAALARVSLRNPWHFLALGFGSGLSPFMPGTAGSIAAIPLVLSYLWLPVAGQLVVALIATLIGIQICDRTSRDMQVHDHSAIVWDEVAGMLLTFIAIPLTLSNLVLGFLLFRIFDIWKPWPISFLDKNLHGGLGIMLDDVVAGLFALAGLHALQFYAVVLF
ncbi:MAG: phosphatidylglycerophosphatase A [Aestuariibacter sp.]